jgi:sec-independent protein translocase protein TatA
MFRLGWLEVGLVILAAVLVFGPKKIPELGRSLGQSLRGFKDEIQGTADSDLQDPEA